MIIFRSLGLAFCAVSAWLFTPWVTPSAAAQPARAQARQVAIQGTVTDAQGRPVEGATVALVTDVTIVMTLTGGELRPADADVAPVTAVSDARGRYALPGVDARLVHGEVFAVAATHPARGYGEAAGEGVAAPAAAPGRADVRLAPWARLKGIVTLGGAPAAGTRVRLTQAPLVGPQLWAEELATAGPDGRFAVERCRPGVTVIEYRLPAAAPGDGVKADEGGHGHDTDTGDEWRRADVEALRPGETKGWACELQRRGVRGRLVAPAGAAMAIEVIAFLRRVPERPAPALPDEALVRFGDDRKRWLANWVATTDEGRAYAADRVRFENQSHEVRLAVDPAGRLSGDDVPAGTYRLHAYGKVVIPEAAKAGDAGDAAGAADELPGAAAAAEAAAGAEFYEPRLFDGRPGGPPPPADPSMLRDAAATVTVRVDADAAAPAAGDAPPAALPDVELQSFTRLNVGEAVPDLVLRRLVGADGDGADGQPGGATIDLRSYRGRYVLLDCWATWCGPCLEATPALKAIHEAYATAKNELVIVGVSFDEDPATAAQYVRREALPWEQAVVATAGGASATADPVELGGLFGGGLPNFVLIDPHGRLASTGHDLSAVKKILAGDAPGGGRPAARE